MTEEISIKALLYRSLHRGCKETDILLGKFATARILSFSNDELKIYQDFIIEDDAEIYDWILRKTPSPQKYYELILEIRKFHDL